MCRFENGCDKVDRADRLLVTERVLDSSKSSTLDKAVCVFTCVCSSVVKAKRIASFDALWTAQSTEAADTVVVLTLATTALRPVESKCFTALIF